MKNLYPRFISLAIILLCLAAKQSIAQSISINNSLLSSGPYGQGSTIAAPIDVSGCFNIGNTFNLYLSDASGNFATEKLIGSYANFFTTFVNGTIPTTQGAGVGYKLRVKSTSPVIVSAASNALQVSVFSPALVATADPLLTTKILSPQIAYGWCSNVQQQTGFVMVSTTTAGAVATATIKDEINGNVLSALPYDASSQLSLDLDRHYYTFITKAAKSGVISTKAYFVINSPNKLGLSTDGEQQGCLPDTLTFQMGVDTTSGIGNNFPGNRYQIDWGDGTALQVYTQCNLLSVGGLLKHYYVGVSCSKPNITFNVTTTLLNPWYNNAGTATQKNCDQPQVVSRAKIFKKPDAQFSFPNPSCVNVPVTFANNTDPGQAQFGTQCINKADYRWYINGVLVQTNIQATPPPSMTHTFTAVGKYEIKLVVDNGSCEISTKIDSICIEPKPVTNFKINGVDSLVACAPLNIATTNLTTGSPVCQALGYLWTVIDSLGNIVPAGNGTFTISPNNSNFEPSFIFLKEGKYKIRLTVTNVCGGIVKERPVIILGTTNAALPSDKSYCGLKTINFGTDANHKPAYNISLGNETYSWTVTGGSYSFIGGTNASSALPQIKFNDYATYTVKIDFGNLCGTATSTQKITFNEPVANNVTSAKNITLCFGDNTMSVAATTTGPADSTRWFTTGTGTFGNRNATSTVYTLSAADKTSGSIKIYFKTFAIKPTACPDPSDTIYVNIIPHNYITSASPKEICSNTKVAYAPTAFASGSTFNWTSAVQSGTLNGNTATGNGDITDSLINTSFSTDAIIKYTITPTKDGCIGDPFDLLVTVKPLPNLNAAAVKDSICADAANIINLGSSATGITYTWSSSVSGGTVTGNSNQSATTSSAQIKDTLYNAGTTNATVTYTIKVFGSTGCEGQTKTVTVVVRPKPSMAIAGNDLKLCNQASLVLSGNNPVAGNGLWTLVSGPSVTFTNAAAYNTTVNGLQPNTTYAFEWRITGTGNCSYTKDTVVIINRPPVTVANAGLDKSICDFTTASSNTVTLSANLDNTRSFETGIWDLIDQPAGGNGGFSLLSNSNAVFTFSKVGTYTLVWKISNDNGCTPTMDTMLINVYPKPVAGVTAPTSAITCNGTDVTINLQSYTGIIKKWQYNKNPINDNIWVDTAVTSPFITLQNLQDTILIRCIVGSGGDLNGCPSYDTSVYSFIAVNPKTLGGNTNPDAIVCKDDNNGTIALTGNTGTVQRWEFSINSGSTWNQVNNTTAAQSYTNLNTSTVYRAMVQSGVCPPKYSDTTTITVVDPVSTSNAGADQLLCNQASATLNGSNPASGSGKWFQEAGPAVSFSNTLSSNTGITNLQGNQVYKFVWKITGLGNCPPSTDTVVIINRPSTTQANAGTDKVICDFTPSSNNSFTLNGNMDNARPFETGKWRIVQQPTSSSAYFNDDTKFNALFSFNKAGAYQLEWAISNDAGCAPTKDTLTINVFDKPVAGTLNASPITSCYGSTVTASMASYTGIIKKWQYNPKPFNDNIWIDATGTNSSINFSNVQDSFAVRVIVQSSGVAMGCSTEVISDSIVVNITPKTIAGKVFGNATVCETSNAGNVNLTNYAGNIIKWQNSYDNGTNWIDIASNSPTINYTNLPISMWYRAVVQNGVCPQLYSDTAVITVVKTVSPANAGVDKLICNQASIQLNGNIAAAGETGLWQQVNGPSATAIAPANAASTSATGLVAGTYTYQWTLSNNACPSTKDTMVVVNRPAITPANAGPDKVVCDFSLSDNNSVQLSGNLASLRPYETGKWKIVQKPSGSLAYFDNDTKFDAVFNFSKSGPYQLEWAISNDAGCPSTKDTININVFDKPVAGIVSASPITACYGSNATASISSYTGAIKKWQYNPKPFDDNIWIDVVGTNNTINFSNLQDSFAVRAIIQSAGAAYGCSTEVVSDSAIVNITPKTVPGKLIGTATVCEISNLGNINLTNYAGNITKWQSSVDNGTSWIDIYTNSSIISYNNLNLTTWYRAIVQSGVCPQQFSDTAIINVAKMVTTAIAGTNRLLCSQTSIQLNGNSAATGETGLWSQISGPSTATITAPNLPNATVNGLIDGTYKFKWSISNAACPPTKDSVVIVNRPAITVANAGNDIVVCDFTASTGNYTLLNANLNNTRPYEAGKWRMIQQPASSSASFDNDTKYNAVFSFNKSGIYKLEWTISNDAGCPPTKDTIVINVFDKPAVGAVAASPITACYGSNITASLSSYTGLIKKWQYNPKPINDNTWLDATGTGSAINFNNAQDSFAVRVIIQSAGASMGCNTEVISDSVLINIAPQTVPGKTAGNATVCELANTGNINLASYVGNIVKWQSSTNNGISWIDIANTASIISYSNLSNTTWFRAVVQSGVCPPMYSDTAIIVVSKTVNPANAGVDKLICNLTSIQLNGNIAATGETGLWQQLNGPSTTNIVSANAAATNVTGLLPGSYSYQWTLSNSICPATKDTVLIVNRPAITQSDAGTDKVICDFTVANNGNITLSANLDNTRPYEIGKWRIVQQPASSATSFDNDTKYNAVFSFNKSGIYKLEWTISNDAGCPPTKDTVTINVFDKPVVGTIAASPIIACYGSTITASLASYTGIIKKWQYNPKPVNDNIWLDAAGTGSAINFNNAQDSFAVRVIIKSAGAAMGCNTEVTSDSVLISITPQTVPGKTAGSGNVCAIGNFGNISLTNYAGNIIKWQSSVDNGTSWIDIYINSAIISYNNLSLTTWYRAIVQSGVCPPMYSDTAFVAVSKTVNLANAGVDKLICNQASFQLNGNIAATGETGLWQQLNGPSTTNIVSANAAATNVTGLLPGTYMYQWTLSNNGCPSTKDTVVIVNRPPITQADAGTDKIICDFTPANNNNIGLTGNFDIARPYEALKWRMVQQPASSSASFDNDTKYNAVFSFNKSGIYKLEWTISNDAGCPPTKDTIVINVFDKPVVGAVAASPITACYGSNITASLSSYTGLIKKWQYNPKPVNDNTWLDATGTGSAINFNNAQDSFAVRVIIQSAGASMGCNTEVTSDSVLINIAPQTVPGKTAGNTTVCELANTGNINLASYVGNIVKWQSSTNNGISWIDIANTASIISYSNLSNTTWFRAVVQSGVCPPMYSDTAIIAVSKAVNPANAGPDKQLCADISTQLIGNAIGNGETGLWRQVSGPSTATIVSSSTSTTTVNNLVNGTYQFEWKLANSVCPSTRDTVIIINYPSLQNSISATDIKICSGQPVTINGTTALGGNGSYTYQWQQSADNINWTTIPAANGINYSFLATDTVYIRRLVESSPCNSISPIVKVLVQKPISNNNINANQSICINTAATTIIGSLPGGADGNYQYQWQQSNDGGITWNDMVGATQKDYAPGTLTQTIHYRRIVSSMLCNGLQSSTSSMIAITVNPDAKAQYSYTQQTGCAPFNINNTIIINSLFPNNNGSYNWYVNNNFLGSGNDFPGYILATSYDSVKIKLVAISKYGCKNDSLTYSFYTKAVPQPAFSITDTIGCGPLQVSFTNNTPNSNLFQYEWNFGNGQTSSIINPNTITYQQALANVDTVYRATLTAFTTCDTLRVEKFIRIQSKPMARFLPDKVTGCSPMTVTFTNTSISTVATYDWDFGDGTTITTTNKNAVQHTFYTGVPTVFNVKLKVTNQCGSDSLVYPVTIQQNAILLNYNIAGDNKVCAPFNVKFINASIGSTGFKWDFGDGTIVNTTKNIDTVYHTYFTPGDYNVQLRASNGCSDTTATRVLFVNRKPISDFTALPSSVCVGDTVHFTNLTDTATSYVWKFDDGFTSNHANTVHGYATAGVYNVKLQSTRTFINGGSCVDSSNKTVTIVAKLPGAFLVSDTLGKCTPFVVTLTNLNMPSALTTWNLGNGILDTGNVIIHTFNTVGTYTISMVAQSIGGCKYEAQKEIKVQGPSGSFTYDNGFFCGNKPVRFQTNMQNVDSVRFNFGDGNSVVTTSNIVYHTYAQSGKYVPSAELMAGATCNVLLKGLDTIKVDYIKAGYTFNQQNFCGYAKVNLIDTSRSYFGVQDYYWTFGDGGTSNIASPQHQYNNTNTWAVQLIIKTNSGCYDTVYQPLFVHVPQKPQASIQSDTVGCVNEMLHFYAVVNSIDTLNYYKWNFTSGYSSSNTTVSTSFPVAGFQTAQLIAGTTNGCYDTSYKQVRINPNPFVRANQDMQICLGQTTPLNATGALNYIWSPTQNLSCSTCPNTLVAPQTTTQYVVAGTNQFGCAGYDTVVVNVAQPFAISVSANDTLCIGQSAVLNAQGASKYQWSPANGLNSITVSTPTATPTITTKYRVIGLDDYNCFRDTAYVTVAVGQYPQVNIGPDKVQQTGNLMPLKATFTNGPITAWRWGASDFNCATCAEPVVLIKKDACYYVEARNQYGCAGRDTMCVKVFFNDGQVFIPNAFTPDGDGINDIFMVRGKGIKQVKSFRIFSRWGQVVFERSSFPANDAKYGWDGKINGIPAPPDVFVYTCEVIAENDEQYITKGNVTILK